jgi:glycosyltransferase involved in cell wall biosynthesis
MKKKITVCIQSYNHGKYIAGCIQSILNQTYKNFNIIIFDDGSNDETIKIVKRIISENKNKKIRLIRTNSPKNHTNFNNILKSYKIFGEYFTIFHSDDIYEPNILEEQVKFMDNNQDVIATSTNANLINNKNKFIRTVNIPHELKKISKINNLKFIDLLFNYGFFLMTPSFIYRTIFFKKKKIFFNYQKFGWAADAYFFYTLSKYNSIGFIKKRLFNYRVSNESLSHNLRKNNTNISDLFKVLKKILKEKKFNADTRKQFIRNYNFLLMLNYSNINLNKIIKGEKKLKKVKLIKNLTLAFDNSFKLKRFVQATILKILWLSPFAKNILIFLNKLR